MMMKVALVVLAAVLAVVLAGDDYGYSHEYYYPGFKRGHNGISAVYRNDVRQHQVNAIAEHYGAGTGTARWEGVPGTNGYYGYNHHAGYGYPRHGGYGSGSYGYGAHGYAGHGYGHRY